jgi:hypothetical protein
LTRQLATPSVANEAESLNELVKQALEARPEVKAGELAIEAAVCARQVGTLAHPRRFGHRQRVWDAARTASSKGLACRSSCRSSTQQGGISRAEAEIERAAKQLIAARQRIVAEVREAYIQLVQCARSASSLAHAPVASRSNKTSASLKSPTARATWPTSFVLETARRYSDEALREAEFQAATGRALAQLERSVGRRLIAKP